MRTRLLAPVVAATSVVGLTGCFPDPGPGPNPEPEPFACADGVVAPASDFAQYPIAFSADSSTMAIVIYEGTSSRIDWHDLTTGESATIASVDQPSGLEVRVSSDGSKFYVLEHQGYFDGAFHATASAVDRDGNVLTSASNRLGWNFNIVTDWDVTKGLVTSFGPPTFTLKQGTVDLATDTLTEFVSAPEHTGFLPLGFGPSLDMVVYDARPHADLASTVDGTTIRRFVNDGTWTPRVSFLDADTLFFKGTVPTEVDAPEGSAVIYRISTDSFEVITPPVEGAVAIAASLDAQRAVFTLGETVLYSVTPEATTEHDVQFAYGTTPYVSPNLDRALYRSDTDEWTQLCLGG